MEGRKLFECRLRDLYVGRGSFPRNMKSLDVIWFGGRRKVNGIFCICFPGSPNRRHVSIREQPFEDRRGVLKSSSCWRIRLFEFRKSKSHELVAQPRNSVLSRAIFRDDRVSRCSEYLGEPKLFSSRYDRISE